MNTVLVQEMERYNTYGRHTSAVWGAAPQSYETLHSVVYTFSPSIPQVV